MQEGIKAVKFSVGQGLDQDVDSEFYLEASGNSIRNAFVANSTSGVIVRQAAVTFFMNVGPQTCRYVGASKHVIIFAGGVYV